MFKAATLLEPPNGGGGIKPRVERSGTRGAPARGGNSPRMGATEPTKQPLRRPLRGLRNVLASYPRVPLRSTRGFVPPPPSGGSGTMKCWKLFLDATHVRLL